MLSILSGIRLMTKDYRLQTEYYNPSLLVQKINDPDLIQIRIQLRRVVEYPVFYDLIAFTTAKGFNIKALHFKKKNKLICKLPFGDSYPLGHNSGPLMILG
jgi:hypothetical protein